LLNGILEEFGYRLLGPYLVSYCDWLQEYQRTLGDDSSLLFLARDGYLLYLVYRTLYPQDVHRCHYLVASRVAAQLCSIADESTATAWLQQAQRSAGLSSLLQAEARRPAIGDSPLGPSDMLDLARRHRSAYRAHIQEQLSDGPVLVVDIGYGGSTQANLARLLNRTVHGAYFVTHRSARVTAAEAGSVQSFDASLLAPHARKGLVNPQRYFFETVLSEAKGSFVCFAEPGRPVFEPFDLEDRTAALLVQIRQGVERYAQNINRGDRERADQRSAREALGQFLADPHPADAALFAGLAFDDRLKGVMQRYIVIPPERRADGFGLWVEGQRAVDLDTDVAHGRALSAPWRRLEDQMMRRGLTTAQYACYATNRELFKKANGCLIIIYMKALNNVFKTVFSELFCSEYDMFR
jgi:hypothetical protein